MDSVNVQTSAKISNNMPILDKGIMIQEVDSKKRMREFIHLPAAIHKDHHNWVPPIYMDDWDFFNKKKK